MKRYNRSCGLVPIVLSAVLVRYASAAELINATNAAPTVTGASVTADDEEWSRHVVQNYQQYLDQQQATLEAIEQTRLAAAAAAAAARQNAEETEARLRRIEAALLRQHSQELIALQDSHRTVLVAVSVFAVLGLGGLVAVVFLVRRAGRRAGLAPPPRPVQPALAPRDTPALGDGNAALATVATADQATAQFLGALERLEKRVQEMEQAAPLSGGGAPMPGHTRPAVQSRTRPARISALLGKGQTLLTLQQADQALACFDEAIAVDDRVAEVHLKRGTALERLGRFDEAIASYDQAICLDDSLTAAYLSKANVCSHLERYGEALECYEHALGAQSRTTRPAKAPPPERPTPAADSP